MHTTILRGLAALLAFVAAASFVRAGPETPATDEKLSQVRAQLQEVTNKLSAIQIRQDIQIQSMQTDVSQLKADVSRLNDEIRHLSTVRTSISASINPETPAPLTGTLVLENHYTFPATFVVNGHSIRVQPSQGVRVTEPVGRFNYEVFTDDHTDPVQPLSDRLLVAGKPYPITVHPLNR